MTATARILVVDDEPTIASMVATILRREGHETLEAHSGTACLTLLEREVVDLVLLDVTMPDVDGFAVCEALRARPALRELPVILLTGRTDLDTRREGMHHGVSEFLTKPVNRHELIARVRAQLRIVTLTRELERVERGLKASADPAARS